MKKSLLYFLFLPSLYSGAQSVIHLNYKPSGIIIVFPFQNSKIYTDTFAIDYVFNHPQHTEYEKYFARVRNLLQSLYRKAINDTIVLEDKIPFEDTVTDTYPENWYMNLTIFQIIHSGKIRITDEEGHDVQAMRIKHPRNKSPDIITTVYINTATKKELFTEIVNTEPLNLVYPPQVISPLTFNHRKLIKEEKDFEFSKPW